MKKEIPEILINGEDAVPMGNIDKFKGHRGSAINGVHVSTSRAESTMTAKRYEFVVTTFITDVHCTTEGRVTTVKHLIYILNDRFARM